MPWGRTLNEDRASRQKEMEITGKWLGEIGGWQAMKAARALLAAGMVELVEKSPSQVRGFVGQGKSRLSSGLRVRSRSDADNLCTCLAARRDGRICEHALAVALASLPALTADSRQSLPTQPRVTAPVPSSPPPVSSAPGQWSIYLPESVFGPATGSGSHFSDRGSASKGGQINRLPPPGKSHTAFVKFEAGEPETSSLNTWLCARGVPRQSTPLSLTASEWPGLLRALTEHPRAFIGRPGTAQTTQLTVTEITIRPLLQIQPSVADPSKNITLSLGESPQPRLLNFAETQSDDTRWLFHPSENSLHPWALPQNAETRQTCLRLFQQKTGESTRQSLHWLAKQVAELEKAFQLTWDISLQNSFQIIPVAAKYLMQLSGNERAIRLEVWGQYQSQTWQIGKPSALFPFENKHKIAQFYVQNVNYEKAICAHLKRYGLSEIANEPGVFEVRGEREVTRFFASHLPALESEFEVHADEQWTRATRDWLRIRPQFIPLEIGADSHSIDWLSANLNYQADDGFRLSRNEVLRLLRAGQVSLKSKRNQRYIIDTESCEEYEEMLRDVPLQLTATGARFQARYAGYLLPQAQRTMLAQTQDDAADLLALRSELGELGRHLRQYQLEAVAWLIQRLKAGQGALLGDDMGLGKTLQSIAAMQWQLRHASSEKPQALVICPKSLISNWVSELQRFAPALKVLAISGSDREKQHHLISDNDVIITSYQLIVRDLKQFCSRQFELLIIDEASFIRNPETETAKAVRALPYRSAIALSGTPVENGVRDLWSIYEVLLPGYLGARSHFQERFEKPLQAPESTTASSAAKRLRRLIRPFFLRRSKSEVLQDLPEKLEQILWCEPSAAQAELYRRLLEEGREEIRAAKRRGGQQGARMTMLTVLLRLRQACCDLRLTGVTYSVTKTLSCEDYSGKWPVFLETLNEALACQSKVLVFSQFVSYLQLGREILDDLDIRYSYLDGATVERQAAVETFQNDPRCRVFLISLKAGGYGLNLTQADRVFLLDPWWNPAIEAQAIDRAHRFGQTRAVNAYRLIMRGTIEERILDLQRKKRGLIATAIEERAPMMKGLNDDDLETLLSLE